MSTERDELAELIDKTDDTWMGVASARDWAGAMADAILAAGYRKPRVVTTESELDALPVGTVVLSEVYAHYVADFPVTFQKWPDGYWYRGGRLSDTHPDNFLPAAVLPLPEAPHV